jgi:hypothetical protein
MAPRRAHAAREKAEGALVGSGGEGYPSGPWVLVLGMHRSGTSALTGALARLGLATPAPDDLVTGHYDNPVHFESAALSDLDDALLDALGGSWSAPPPLMPGWERAAALGPVLAGGPGAARRAFPGQGPLVWKDPRLCLLLPLWRAQLPGPPSVVMVWRAPMAVAQSLHARQAFTVSLGLALWEHYARHALTALAGEACYVVRYEDLVAAPRDTLAGVAHWLAARGAIAAPAPAALVEAAASVSGTLARHDGAGADPEELADAVAALAGADGPQQALRVPTLPSRPGWMHDAIEQQRAYEGLYARYLRYVKWRRRIPLIGRAARR